MKILSCNPKILIIRNILISTVAQTSQIGVISILRSRSRENLTRSSVFRAELSFLSLLSFPSFLENGGLAVRGAEYSAVTLGGPTLVPCDLKLTSLGSHAKNALDASSCPLLHRCTTEGMHVAVRVAIALEWNGAIASVKNLCGYME